jgi:hypothetical protein
MKAQTVFLLILVVVSFPFVTLAQVNSGSNGSDGAFNPTQNVTIDMNLRPDGIYHYTSVTIPSGVTVTFTPNANNTPVVWLLQGDCVVNGIVDVSGQRVDSPSAPGLGGPGGWAGGNGGVSATAGRGPGGGIVARPDETSFYGGSHASLAQTVNQAGGVTYGNVFIIPLVGGSGGGGIQGDRGWIVGGGGWPGSGGGGAMLVAATGRIVVDGTIRANGGSTHYGADGSGGAVRLVCSQFHGRGAIRAVSEGLNYSGGRGGQGRVRIDTMENLFSGTMSGAFTVGFQPIILPAAGQGTQLSIQSIGGIPIGGSPNGVLANPDVIIPPQQQNPMNVVVGCSNLPLNTLITVVVRPANGEEIVTTGRNTNGSVASSTVSIPVTMPRGGGIVYAKYVSGVNGVSAASSDSKVKNIAQTGWTADGETFAQMEIVAGLDGRQQVAYITESGKRYALPQD